MRIGDKILIRDRVVYFYGYEYEPSVRAVWVQFSDRPDIRRQLQTDIIERWKVCESATVLHTEATITTSADTTSPISLLQE